MNGGLIIMDFFNEHLIGVVMHQMVTRGYNVFAMQLADLYIADSEGNILEKLESKCRCIVYNGLPCCPYCLECIEHSPLCFYDGVCRKCGNCEGFSY